MKTLLSVLLGFCVTVLAFAQPPGEIGTPKRTPEELEKLVAPIALYPDALIALILPASTNTPDVVLAARFLSSNPGANDFDSQPWEDSVKSLARYPEVINWMDENLTWTRELGESFAAQPADVMNTIQKLRADARATGLLKDTPQQRVVVQDSEVCIVPAEENVIYVPSYDPDVLILRRPYYDSWLTFSVGFATGSWLYYDCDWSSRNVWIYRRPSGWAYRPDWRWHDRDRARVMHEQWRPSPAYWHHINQTRTYGYRPVPHVEPPRFRGQNTVDADRRWDRRRDDRLSNEPRPGTNRPGNDRDRSWDQRQHDRSNGVTPASNDRIRHGNTVSPTPPVSVSPNRAVAVDPSASPAVNAVPITPMARPSPERWHRPDGFAGERNGQPREINNPAAQRTDTPSAVRLQPPAPPSPERIGQVGPRSGQFTPRQPERPANNYHPAPAAVAPPPVVQRSAPVSAPPPTVTPAPAPAPAASAPVTDPGRDQRGGYRNRGSDDDRKDRR